MNVKNKYTYPPVKHYKYGFGPNYGKQLSTLFILYRYYLDEKTKIINDNSRLLLVISEEINVLQIHGI